MIDHERTGLIAALERVRAQLGAEKENAGSAVHDSWQLIGKAIEHLRAATGIAEDARPDITTLEHADDLTSIHGVSAALAEHLTRLGVTRYAEIAAWRSDDVRRVAQALGLTREISRQNWIEQAALLDQRRAKENSAIAGDAAALTLEAGSVVAPAEGRQIDLPEILEAIRKDETPSEAASPPYAVPAGANERPPAAPAASAAPVAPPPGQSEAARVELASAAQRPSGSQGARIPTVAASPHVSTDAAERAKRLAEERQRLAQNLERAGVLRPQAEEAAVSFVIREDQQSRQSDGEPSTPPRRDAVAFDPAPPPYIASSAEEAEVVVVKPQTYSFPDSPRHPKERSVRRFLKALTGR